MENIFLSGNNLIILIKDLLNNSKNKINDADFSAIYKLAKYHSVENLLYYALNYYKQNVDESINVSSDILKSLTKDNRNQINMTACQEAELECLKEELNKNKIRYSLMKGSILKYLYPSVDMRSMGDIDIYFDKKYNKQVKNIFKDLGYDTLKYNKDNHDEYVKEPFVHVEMHKEMINEIFSLSHYYNMFYKNDNFYHFYKTSENKDDYEYTNNEEDFYIFLIAHAARHFSSGGTGIRTVVDEYLYLSKYEDKLDYKYIKQELDKLELSLFEQNLNKLSKYWFKENNNFTSSEIEIFESMSEYIYASGTYGNKSNDTLNKFVGKDAMKDLNQNRFLFILRRLFPSYQAMVWRNPILKKWKILLPIFYITRLFRGAFVKRKASLNEYEYTKNLSDEEIKKNKDLHKNVGA